MTRILICGLGSIGRRHLRNLRALGQQDIVLLRTGKSTLPEVELTGLPVEHDLGIALVKWRPDAVVVATPTALHLETAIPGTRAGCHLLLEKPISHSMVGVAELQEEVTKSGSRVLVGFQFRFHPGLQAVKRLLEQGAVGTPTSVQANWGEYLPGWHPWEDYRNSYSARSDLGGGVVLTLCHPLDYLSWLFGRPDRLWARAAHLSELDLNVEDTADIALMYANGVTASVHLDYVQRPPEHSLRITGTQGTIRWDGSVGSVRVYNAKTGTWRETPPPPGFERNALFLDEMRHFLQVVDGSAAPACTLDDGVSALRLCLASKESSSSGCVVELPS
jgi:predicted dehydrogenase